VFGDNSEKNANNLRVTLFRIKNAFHETGVGKEKFLIREDLSVEIADGVCDVVDFQRFIKNNLRINAGNIAQAEKINDSVSGELLADIDTLWITEKREWVTAQTEMLLVNMSIYYLSGGFLEQAEAALLSLIRLNPISEQGYHRLLDLHMRAGDTLKYCYCYERYLEMTEKEFGVQPPNIYANYYEESK